MCTLKGGAYYWDGEDAWIKVYQIKMKAEKMIPNFIGALSNYENLYKKASY